MENNRKMVESLSEANRLLEGVANSTDVLMACLDSDFNFIWVNRAYAEAGDREPEEYAGLNHFELYPNEENEAIFRRVVESGEPFSIRSKPFKHPDQPDRGTTYWDWRLVPIKDEQGRVERLFFTLTDVTERERDKQRLRDNQAQLSAIIQNAPFVMLLVDRERRVRLTNRRGAEFAGKTVEEIKGMRAGKALRCIHSLDDPKGCGYGTVCENCGVRKTVLNTIETGQSHEQVEVEMRFEREGTDTEGRTFLIYTNSLKISGEDLVLVVFEDVSERKRAEQELKRLNARLEQRVAERTAEAEQRAEQLQRLTGELTHAEEQERRRIARILHDDLQQTLAYAQLRASMLSSSTRGSEEQTSTAEEVVESISEAIATSRNLSRDLNPPLLHTEGLGPALDHLASQTARQYGLEVDVSIEGGEDELDDQRRAFAYRATQELLFNCVKHAETERANLRMNREDRTLRITVEDEGAGFDPAKLRDGDVEELGMGLFSIEERAALLGGSLDVDSAPGAGSRFTLKVPIGVHNGEETRLQKCREPGLPQQTAPLQEPEAGQELIRILLADDHDVMRDGLASTLASEPDIQVVGEAADGQEAIEKTLSLDPDVVLMDVSMPEVNGVEATRQIRDMCPDVRIIALSMHAMEVTEKCMRAAGADTYLTKDGPTEHLLSAIRQADYQKAE